MGRSVGTWIEREGLLTICFPRGIRETGISLKLAIPSGIPMIVMQSRIPVATCVSASHQPASTNQRMLPIVRTRRLCLAKYLPRIVPTG